MIHDKILLGLITALPPFAEFQVSKLQFSMFNSEFRVVGCLLFNDYCFYDTISKNLS